MWNNSRERRLISFWANRNYSESRLNASCISRSPECNWHTCEVSVWLYAANFINKTTLGSCNISDEQNNNCQRTTLKLWWYRLDDVAINQSISVIGRWCSCCSNGTKTVLCQLITTVVTPHRKSHMNVPAMALSIWCFDSSIMTNQIYRRTVNYLTTTRWSVSIEIQLIKVVSLSMSFKFCLLTWNNNPSTDLPAWSFHNPLYWWGHQMCENRCNRFSGMPYLPIGKINSLDFFLRITLADRPN
jgi:hypothetical protein